MKRPQDDEANGGGMMVDLPDGGQVVDERDHHVEIARQVASR